MKERIHWCRHPLPPQSHIRLPNQNQPPKLVPLWTICVFLAAGLAGVDIPWHAPCDGANTRSKLWHRCSLAIFPCTLVHKAMSKYVGWTGEWMTTLFLDENLSMTLRRGVRTWACSLEELSYEFPSIPYLSTAVLPKLVSNWVLFRSVVLLSNAAQIGESSISRLACALSGCLYIPYSWNQKMFWFLFWHKIFWHYRWLLLLVFSAQSIILTCLLSQPTFHQFIHNPQVSFC